MKDLDSLNAKRVRSDIRFKQGLESLKQRNYIIVCPADKGGGIVVLEKSTYLLEMERILSDHETYSSLPSNPTNGFKKELVRLIDEDFQTKILSKKKDHLVPMATCVPVMYYLPKVHKDPANPPR